MGQEQNKSRCLEIGIQFVLMPGRARQGAYMDYIAQSEGEHTPD